MSSCAHAAFSSSLIPVGLKTSCDCADGTVRQALDRILKGTELSYSEVRGQVVIEPRVETPRSRPAGVALASHGGFVPQGRPVSDAPRRVARASEPAAAAPRPPPHSPGVLRNLVTSG